jgi:stage II sporulation protein D
MKDYIKLLIVIFIFLSLVPVAAIFFIDVPDSEVIEVPDNEIIADVSAFSDEYAFSENDIKIYQTKTGDILKIPITEYIAYALLAETPPETEPEALMAQAVIINTYAVRQILKNMQSPDPALFGGDVSDDFTQFQAFFTDWGAKAFYGGDFDRIYKDTYKIAEQARQYIIVYEDEPIIAASHLCSPGKTESALNVWGSDIPYLVSVESPLDRDYPGFEADLQFTAAEIKARFNTESDIVFDENFARWIRVTDTAESGVVLTVKVGDKSITGGEFRNILSLNSAAFTVDFDGEYFNIKTFGFGHGVGLSRNGANSYAAQGWAFKEILLYYYPDTEIATLIGQ